LDLLAGGSHHLAQQPNHKENPMSATVSVNPLTGAYAIDADHSSAAFAVRHMGISTFRGSFAGMSGSVQADDQGRVIITGAVAVEGVSVKSPVDLRTHLLGEDFFDADRHPQIAFAGQAAEANADGTITVEGDLTMRNVTRRVVATGTWTEPVEDPFGGVRAAIELSTTVDRRDYGMTWNMPLPKGGDALGHQVEMTVHLELVAA
jgi:polyisoprenoid-binding protein YceI